jgi:hypothetical protein
MRWSTYTLYIHTIYFYGILPWDTIPRYGMPLMDSALHSCSSITTHYVDNIIIRILHVYTQVNPTNITANLKRENRYALSNLTQLRCPNIIPLSQFSLMTLGLPNYCDNIAWGWRPGGPGGWRNTIVSNISARKYRKWPGIFFSMKTIMFIIF